MPLATSPLATSNRASIRYIEETNFGVTPATAPTALRFTGESLAQSISTESSKELRADRLVADNIQTDLSASGGFNFELSYGEYDPFMQAVLGGTWDVMGTLGEATVGTAALNSTTGTITASVAPTGNDALTRLKPGQWFRLKAAGDAADGAILKVGATAPTSTVITLDASTPLPGSGTRPAVAAVKLSSSRLTDGTVNRAFSIERSFDDIGQFFIFRGMTANKMDLNFDTSAILTGSFDFMGKNGARNTSTFLGGGTIASQTYDVINSVTGIGSVYENGTALTGTYVKSLKLSVDAKLRALKGLGSLGAVRINQGTLAISGTAEIYLADGTLYDKFVNNTATSLCWGVRDGTSRGYQFTLPKVKFKDAKVNAGGLDQDAMLSVPFEALADPITGHALLIDRFSV